MTKPKPPRRPASTPARASSTTAGTDGGYAESSCRSEKDRRVGFPRQAEGLGVQAVDDGVEQIIRCAAAVRIALACRLDEIRAVLTSDALADFA